MVTNDWATNVGLTRFPNTLKKTILLINGDIFQEQVVTYKKKMHIILEQNELIH